MGVITAQFSLVDGVPQRLVAGRSMTTEVHIHNHEHQQGRNLYIGANSSVSETNGHHILADTDLQLFLQPGDEVWGMTDTNAGCDVTVLILAKD